MVFTFFLRIRPPVLGRNLDISSVQSHELHRLLRFPSVRLRHHTVTEIRSYFRGSKSAMEKPEELANITKLSDHVVRVLGQNPGKFTLQGTNTYLVGSQNPYILIDTGEGISSYIPVLESALGLPDDPARPDVSDIILSHWHHDHIGGLPSVLALLKQLWEKRNSASPYVPPKLHKYPFVDGATGGHHTSHNQLPRVLENLNPDLYTPTPQNAAIHDLVDGQTFRDPTNGAPLLRVLHTPGHTVDSISLYIPQDRALYTADTVLGHGTAVFEDLATYLASLNKMLHFGSPGTGTKEDIDLEYVALYPAHGAVVRNGRETISTYIKHRLERESQILGVLHGSVPQHLFEEAGKGDDGDVLWTTWTIVRVLYKAYPENLWLPATMSVDLHLRKLEGDGLVKRLGGEAIHTKWKAFPSKPSSPSL